MNLSNQCFIRSVPKVDYELHCIMKINSIKMATSILIFVGLLAFALFYKAINWFEKI